MSSLNRTLARTSTATPRIRRGAPHAAVFVGFLLASVSAGCGGAQAHESRAHSVDGASGFSGGCAGVLSSRTLESDAVVGGRDAARDGQHAAALVLGEAAFQGWQDDAAVAFGAGVAAAERRAFFDRWVFVDPPVLRVHVDRFVVEEPVALLFACSARAEGDDAAMVQWLRRGALPETGLDEALQVAGFAVTGSGG